MVQALDTLVAVVPSAAGASTVSEEAKEFLWVAIALPDPDMVMGWVTVVLGTEWSVVAGTVPVALHLELVASMR